MKALILSDSHRIMKNAYKVLKKINKDIDAVIHLGDNTDDADEIRIMYPELDVFNISGNCDFSTTALSEDIIAFSGKKIFITHGHKYGVKYGYNKILYAAEEKGADICLFGHTHVPVIINHHNIFAMNPGSISMPRESSTCSYGIIDIDDTGEIKAAVVGIFGNTAKIMNVTI